MRMLRSERDFEAFQRVMIQAHQRFPVRICSYCILSNHWHFVAWPEEDGQLSQFFGYLGLTHASRWQVAHNAVGDMRLSMRVGIPYFNRKSEVKRGFGADRTESIAGS
jgi:REP element-mobilizing transposase RayT